MVSVQSTRTMLLLVTPMLYLFNVPTVTTTTTTTMGVTMDREKGHIYWNGHWNTKITKLVESKLCMAQLYN